MTFWSRSHSLQRKIITAIVMVGLLPLTLLLALTYFEERRALRETTGTNFKEVAVDAARRIEMHVTRVMNEGQQLATTPFLRTAVTEANRTYEGKERSQHPGDDQGLAAALEATGQAQRVSPVHQPHRHQLSDPLARHPEVGLCRDTGDGPAGSTGRQFDTPGRIFLRESPLVAGGRQGEPAKSPMSVRSPSIPSFGTHVVVVAAPILDDLQKTVIGAVTVLLRRDTLFHSIADVTIGSTGHAMLFSI